MKPGPRMEQTPEGAQRPAAVGSYEVGVAGPEAAPVPSGSEAPDRLWGACTMLRRAVVGRRVVSWLTALATAGLAACSPGAEAPAAPVEETAPAYAFTNVNVVSMTSDRVDPDQNVVVANGRITAVGPAASVAIPPGARVIEGSGKYLAPGLADMHAHPMTTADLDAYLATGVTLIRAMWGEPAVLELREGVASGAIAGPRIFTGGRIVDGEPVIHYGSDIVLDAAGAMDVVTRHKAAGYDFIKVYSNLSVEAFDAIAEAAKANDIPFAGHIPDAVAADHAFRSGMQAAEHLIGIGPATLADGAEYHTRFDPAFPQYAARIGSGEISLDAVYDEAKLDELADLARETGIWTVPTLTTIRGTAMSPEEASAFSARDAARYVDYTVMSFWQMSAAFRAAWTPDTYRGAQLQLEEDLRQLKAFHDAGARILAGTDAPNPWAFVGFGMVDELELYVEAGLSTYAALQTATTAAAEFMNEAGESGIVARGARADLVLLDGDPLADIAAYRDIDGVMAAGTWFDRAALDERLAAITAASERKAAVFRDAPAWPVEGSESVFVSAEFVLERGEGRAGAERIASVPMQDGSTAFLGQFLGPDGSVRNTRVEAGEGGVARKITAERVAGDGTTERRVYELPGGDAHILTGTALDWLLLGSVLATMQDGETREIPVRRLEDGGPADLGTLTATRHPSEVIVGHFYFTGANRYDIVVSDAGGTRELGVWMGGGFYTGWPVKIVERPSGPDDAAVEYRRIL